MIDFYRTPALNNIPDKKVQFTLDSINNSLEDLATKNLKLTAINRYVESNIPIGYWNLKMERDFKGDPNLLNKYQEYTKDLTASYHSGSSLCFAGSLGCGKTLATTCILKKACLAGFTCLYTMMSDMISALVYSSFEDKEDVRKELTMVDFLAIDEVDSRFLGSSETSAELYGRNLETIFRTRSQNKLPTIFCSNNANVSQIFSGTLGNSLNSLIKGNMTVFVVNGQDFRQKNHAASNSIQDIQNAIKMGAK